MIPVLKLVCQKCSEEFQMNPFHFATMGFKDLPKRCPKCTDIVQGRPSVVIERNCLNVYDGVEVISLPPGEWQKTEGGRKDVSSFQLAVKGRRFGAAWDGRIDLFTTSIPRIGDVVSVREMESRHLVKVREEEKQTLHNGVVVIEKVLPITSDDPNAREVVRHRRYLVVEPFEGSAISRLVWVEAHTKTTLKGFGRQYWTEIKNVSIASWSVSGGVRSDRAHTTGVLAIVDHDHPVYLITKGDIKEEEVYN